MKAYHKLEHTFHKTFLLYIYVQGLELQSPLHILHAYNSK